MRNKIIAGIAVVVGLTLAGGAGSAFATTATPSPSASPVTPPPARTSYVLALWEMLPNGDKFPQKLVASTTTTSTDVHALDAKGTKCDTSYQSDLYANDSTTQKLITKGILNGGDESWPGGSYKGEYSNVFHTAKCAVVTPTPTPTEPPVVVPPVVTPTPTPVVTPPVVTPTPPVTVTTTPVTETKGLAYTGGSNVSWYLFPVALVLIIGGLFVIIKNRRNKHV